MIASNSTAVAEQAQAVFSGLAAAIQDHLTPTMDEAKVRDIAQEVVAARLPVSINVCLPDGKVIDMNGRQHRQFSEVIELVEMGCNNILLVGPAGTGKTTMAKAVAKALDLEFGFLSLSAGVTETHLLGRLLPDASGAWKYKISRFLEVYSKPGLFLLDEVDAADANVMVAVNAALANGILCNPVDGQIYHRHPQCIIIAAANTFGRGGDTMYVGRNALDAATLDRFVLATLFVDYDTDIENDIMHAYGLNDSQCREIGCWIADLREKIMGNRLLRVASTRLVERAAMYIRKGKTLNHVKSRFFQGWSKDELKKVGGAA